MDIKKRTIQDLPRYVKKDGRLLAMLKQIQNGGRTSFLVTNSDWWYTQHIMRFLLAEENSKDTGSLEYKVRVSIHYRNTKLKLHFGIDGLYIAVDWNIQKNLTTCILGY